MSADRTLMSVIRTSLSLISFGFTIFQVFKNLYKTQMTSVSNGAGRNFGTTLVSLGILMLVIGIIYHIYFMIGLRRERRALHEEGLVHAESGFPPSFTLVTALMLLFIGISAIVSMMFKVGPFT